MNIFYTNENPLLAAEDHCKIHMRKMIVEYAQILSAAHHVLDQDTAISGIYKLTHKNHPSAVWLRSGQYQYEWVLDCALHLCKLYTADTGKIHKTQHTLEKLQDLPKNIPLINWQDPPVAAPDKFKALAVFNGSVFAYREYMKAKFKEWKERDKPIKVEFIHLPEWYA
tara:strand:+ start:186 stop:689 length:504 start_codon:yes stop_codon:yes gene_type:complete